MNMILQNYIFRTFILPTTPIFQRGTNIARNVNELRGKFKTESPYSNGKIKSSNTSNEWIITE